jgi:TonB family protein
MGARTRIVSAADLQWESDAVTVPIVPAPPPDAIDFRAVREAPSRSFTSLLVRSEDQVLLEAIRTASQDVATVTISPSADRLADQLTAIGAELALIDAVYAPPGLEEFLDSLHSQFPQLQLLLVGPGNVQHQVARQLTDGTVFRFVHKPASAQRLRLFIDAALRERQTRINQPISGAPAATPRIAAAPRKIGAGGWRPITSPKWLNPSLAAAALIVIAGAAIWHSLRSTRPVAPIQAPATPAPIGAAAASASPLNANSVSAPVAAPREAVREAIDRTAAGRAEKERLAAESQNSKLALAEQARRTASEARARQITQLVQLAQSRIASGALMDPTDDSARGYLSTATELAPEDQRVRALSLALGEAMVAEFHKAMAAGDPAAAERWLRACSAYPVGKNTLIQMSEQLKAFSAAQRTSTAATNAAVNTVTASDSASARVTLPTTPPQRSAETLTASDQIIPESHLRRLSFTAPKYPEGALARGDTGTVDMDFTVTTQGTVTDIRVTESTPKGVFERAAMSALSRDRYQPIERDGVPVPQRVHVRIKFAL